MAKPFVLEELHRFWHLKLLKLHKSMVFDHFLIIKFAQVKYFLYLCSRKF